MPLEICGIPFRQQQPLCRHIQEAKHGLLPITALLFALQNPKCGIIIQNKE
ncbi:unnamed protein product [Brugia timori]|uniref:Uncharacterized protein n=1 Tax=Brugia timori TaxID=42155 RepID=A0A3P7UZ86_9BILA|nr:unnamed protein product [Brugia timori]